MNVTSENNSHTYQNIEFCNNTQDKQHANSFHRIPVLMLTLSAPNKLPSAISLICFNFQTASMSLKVGLNVPCVSNIFDPVETPIYSASHLDPICLHMAQLLCLAG